jgi:hypothetical protein
VSAIFGNTTYGMSIFLQDSSWDYIWMQFPWLVGSLGNVVFDVVLIRQFVRYRKAKKIMPSDRLVSEGDSLQSASA